MSGRHPARIYLSLRGMQYITSRRILADAGGTMAKFLGQGFTELGPKFGPINWQFPATKTLERDDFARFLDLVPSSLDGLPLRHALEPRNDSFRDPAFFDLARARNMAVVFADSDGYPCFEEQTADFTYARLQRTVEDVETGYDGSALDRWAKQAKAWDKGGRDVFVYLISGAKVRNPAAATGLMDRLRS